MYTIFSAEEGTKFPVHTSNVRYTRSGSDYFKVFQAKSAL